jgi:hypothetical protein
MSITRYHLKNEGENYIVARINIRLQKNEGMYSMKE